MRLVQLCNLDATLRRFSRLDAFSDLALLFLLLSVTYRLIWLEGFDTDERSFPSASIHIVCLSG